jgi:hypothetical protein
MAKITPSSLITAIQGKFNNDTFEVWKGAITRRRTIIPVHKPDVYRQRFKNIASMISGRWDALSSAQKTGWDSLADQFPTALSGFNVFMSCNVANIYPDHPALCYYNTVLTCYFIPPLPSYLSVFWMSATVLFCVTWTTPAAISQFVQTFIAKQANYSNKKFPKLRMASTVVSSALLATIDGSTIPSGTVCQFRARTIDKYGFFSSYTNTVTCTIN